MKVIRVFPRKTKASPEDSLAYFGPPGLLTEADKVNISVTFTQDLPKAEELAKSWSVIAPTFIGGPATGMKGNNFTPGKYLKPGYVITSRGCPNRCWFCSVPKREGTVVRELPITDGWNVLDDNLLACSETHINQVFKMLGKQPHKPQFTGGLDPSRLSKKIAKQLRSLHPKSLYMAYDTDDDKDYLEQAAINLWEAGFSKKAHVVCSYVLIGFPKDTLEQAVNRLTFTREIGITPMAMLWKSENGKDRSNYHEWRSLQRLWARPTIIWSKENYIHV